MYFKVGNRVEHEERGEGIVIAFNSAISGVGVQYDVWALGHGCSGMGKDYYCWWESNHSLRKVGAINIIPHLKKHEF